MPVVWPGTSNYHLSNDLSHLDYFPRDNGSFYELQVNTVMKQKPLFIYTAMFDEVNEGEKRNALYLSKSNPFTDLRLRYWLVCLSQSQPTTDK